MPLTKMFLVAMVRTKKNIKDMQSISILNYASSPNDPCKAR